MDHRDWYSCFSLNKLPGQPMRDQSIVPIYCFFFPFLVIACPYCLVDLDPFFSLLVHCYWCTICAGMRANQAIQQGIYNSDGHASGCISNLPRLHCNSATWLNVLIYPRVIHCYSAYLSWQTSSFFADPVRCPRIPKGSILPMLNWLNIYIKKKVFFLIFPFGLFSFLFVFEISCLSCISVG